MEANTPASVWDNRRRKQEQAFINEVSKVANSLQQEQTDLNRTEALRVAEIMVRRTFTFN